AVKDRSFITIIEIKKNNCIIIDYSLENKNVFTLLLAYAFHIKPPLVATPHTLPLTSPSVEETNTVVPAPATMPAVAKDVPLPTPNVNASLDSAPAIVSALPAPIKSKLTYPAYLGWCRFKHWHTHPTSKTTEPRPSGSASLSHKQPLP